MGDRGCGRQAIKVTGSNPNCNYMFANDPTLLCLEHEVKNNNVDPAEAQTRERRVKWSQLTQNPEWKNTPHIFTFLISHKHITDVVKLGGKSLWSWGAEFIRNRENRPSALRGSGVTPVWTQLYRDYLPACLRSPPDIFAYHNFKHGLNAVQRIWVEAFLIWNFY